MPAFDRITETQREGILAYVLGESPRAGSRPDEPASAAAARNVPSYAFGGFRRWADQAGYPAIKPPWGTLNGVELVLVELLHAIDAIPVGLVMAGLDAGLAGAIVTKGGLVFAGGSDQTFYAFDKETGAVLWQAPLPFGGNATPSVYMLNGRQFLVISAGGGKSGRPAGGSLVAFALPKP